MKNISKSGSIIRKEKELKSLEKSYKQLKIQLKRSTTVFEREKNKIDAFQREYSSYFMARMAEIDEIRAEIDQLFQKALSSYKISAEDKQVLRETYKDMKRENFFETGEQLDEEEIRKQAEREFEQSRQTKSQKPKSNLKKEEQKEIRKIFVRLAARFHPDKAKSEEEAKKYHELMQQINLAYQQGDISTLLNLEKQHNSADYEEVTVLEKTTLLSLVEEKLEKIKKEKQMLDNQLQRVKNQTKELRQTELGKLFKDYKAVSKWAEDPMEQINYDVHAQLDNLQDLSEMLETVIKTGELPKVPTPKHNYHELTEQKTNENPFSDMSENDMQDLLNALESIFDGKGKHRKR